MKSIISKSLVLMFFCLQGCSREPEIDVIQEVASPDGNLVATVFKTKGDATVPLGVNVYLGGKGDKIPNYGNVFRGTHSENAQISWVDNKNLIIRTDAEVFLLMKEYAGVTFELRGR